MLEISRVLNLDRLSQKMSSDDSGSPAKSRKKNASVEVKDGTKKTVQTYSHTGRTEYSTTINFEYVPSGRIHMNREARNRIIDFFQ